MAPTLVLLPGKSHGWRSLVGCSPWGRQESDTTERLHFHFSLSCTGEGNGNPLQCSCLENPRDGGAWWAAVCGVAQSRTRLKWLSSSSINLGDQTSPKGSQPRILTGKTDAPVFLSPDANSRFIGRYPDAGKDWRQKEKRASEVEMAGWHHWCNGRELGQTPGDGEGQGGLACYSPWGHEDLDTDGRLNNSNNKHRLEKPNG